MRPTTRRFSCLLVFLSAAIPLSAQEPALSGSLRAEATKPPVFASALEAVASVTARDAHTRVESWTERVIGDDGSTNEVTHRYSVLAPGMHFFDGGEWQPSVPEFVPVPGGWLASRGQFQAAVSSDLFVAGAVTVVSPGGATWRSTPMTLALRDRSSGQVLVLGESRATQGEQVAPDTILFRDAFGSPDGENGLRASVRVIVSAAAIECDVVVESRLPLVALGARPEHCDLVVLTELFGPQAATKETVSRAGRADDVVRLGQLTMDQGRAFTTDAGEEPSRSVRVHKRVYQDEATLRVFLEESAQFDALWPLFESLPEAKVAPEWEARWRDTAGKVGSRKAERGTALRAAPVWPRRADGRFEVVAGPAALNRKPETSNLEPRTLNFERAAAAPSLATRHLSLPTNLEPGTLNLERGVAASSLVSRHPSRPGPGVVLDWSLVLSGGSFTFPAGESFFLTNSVTLGGAGTTVTVSPAVVLKFAPGASLSLASGTTLNWLAEGYKPAILTARDDPSVGETVTGQTTLSTNAYATVALKLDGTGRTTGLVLSNLHVRHAQLAVFAENFGTNKLELRHHQAINCAAAWTLEDGTQYQIVNALVANEGDHAPGVLYQDCLNATAAAYYVTGENGVYATNPVNSTLTLQRSVLYGVANAPSLENWVGSPATQNRTNVFVSFGAGSRYLRPDGAAILQYYDFGGFDSSSAGAEATHLTLFAGDVLPAVLTNASVWTPKPLPALPASISTAKKLAGYRYWRLDCLADNVAVSAPLLFTNGVTALVSEFLTNAVAVGLTGTKAFQLEPGAEFATGGSAQRPARLVRASLVQEGSTGLTNSTFTLFGLGQGSPRPTIKARFTDFLLPSDPSARHTLVQDNTNALASLTLRDCRLLHGLVAFAPVTNNVGQTVSLKNNLFERCDLNFQRYYGPNALTVTLRNNLHAGGALNLYYANTNSYPPVWEFKDNFFDQVWPNLNGTGAFIAAGCNGYTGFIASLGGTNNQTSIVTDWQAGPLGRHYYPATGSMTNLLNTGSTTATTAQLYHHTTQASGAKETNGVVDIGFHFAAPPIDSDGDGLDDAIEDTDGDGVTDATETSITDYDSDNDGLNDSQEPAGHVVSFGYTTVATDSSGNVGTGTSYVVIAAGVSHNLAVRESGQVFAWGNNTYGQIAVPAAATNAVAVAGGERHSLALAETGVVLSWGDNTHGQTNLPSPNTNFTAVAAGYRHSLALKHDGTVKAWGDHTGGQTNVPASATNVIQLAGGQHHSLALKADGSVVAWGTNNLAQITVPTMATSVVEIAAGWNHSLALKADGTVVAWGDNTGGATNVPTGLTNALHVAAGQNFSVVLRNDGTLLAWGSNAYGQTNVPASLTNLQALAAGQARVVTLPYSPVLNYPVNVRRDLLVIYNTNTAASVGITDHYRTNRPHASKANYLGLGLHTNYTYTTLFNANQGHNLLFNPVKQWYAAHPALRPRYVLLSWGVPIWWTNVAGWGGAGGSTQNILRESVPGKKPFLGALNLETTNDVAAYIGKLTGIGASSPPLRVLLSASKTGYGNRVFAFNNYFGVNFSDRNEALMTNAVVALQTYGLPSTNSYHVLGRSQGNDAGCGHVSGQLPLTGVTNPAALVTWGYYACQGAGWSTNGAMTFSGDANWYLLQAYESFNANWGTEAHIASQAKYTDWFKPAAFGGSNYSRTPIGAMSHVAEPNLPSQDTATWTTLWYLGKPLGLVTWRAKDITAASNPSGGSKHDQTNGDPLVAK